MACEEPRMTALKFTYKGEIHRVRVELSTFNYSALNDLFIQTFSLAPHSFVVQYNDAEGDVLNVTSQEEYVEACRVFLSTADAVKSLRFTAVPRTQVIFQEKVADPILKAIERLVETLTAAMEKVKQSEWAERAQSGMEHTGGAIRNSVTHTSGAIKVGVEHTAVALNTAAKDARESLCAAHKQIQEQIQEIPFDQMLKDTSDGLKLAADNISTFALELVDEMKKVQMSVPAQPEAVTVPEEQVADEVAVPVEPNQSVEAVEPEWEQVEEQAVPVAEPIEEAPVVVVAEPEVVEVFATEEGQKWATQISMVWDILPGVDAARVIEALEQCNGNVEVVLNSLMEEM